MYNKFRVEKPFSLSFAYQTVREYSPGQFIEELDLRPFVKEHLMFGSVRAIESPGEFIEESSDYTEDVRPLP